MKKFKWKAGIPDEYVHVMGLVTGGEFTLCGDSFEIDITEFGIERIKGGLIEIREKINCPECIKLINHCKSIKKSEMEYLSWAP